MDTPSINKIRPEILKHRRNVTIEDVREKIRKQYFFPKKNKQQKLIVTLGSYISSQHDKLNKQAQVITRLLIERREQERIIAELSKKLQDDSDDPFFPYLTCKDDEFLENNT